MCAVVVHYKNFFIAAGRQRQWLSYCVWARGSSWKGAGKCTAEEHRCQRPQSFVAECMQVLGYSDHAEHTAKIDKAAELKYFKGERLRLNHLVTK